MSLLHYITAVQCQSYYSSALLQLSPDTCIVQFPQPHPNPQKLEIPPNDQHLLTTHNSTETHHYEHNTAQAPSQPSERTHKSEEDCLHQSESLP